MYLLPACTQFETSGSVTASNRSLQWRERVITPMFESQTDHAIMYAFAKKFGFDKELVKNFKMWKPDGDAKWEEPTPESILKEINRSNWTIGYTGQSPERLKLHMKNQATFDVKSLRAKGGPCDGDYYGLPWPCYGTPELKHPGSPNLYQTSRNVMDGGGNFRANFGVERDGVNLLAEDGSYSLGADLTTGYPEFDHVLMKKLGWWDELTDAEKKAAEGKNWKTDLSGGIQRVVLKNHGCHPFGNAKARAIVWNFPDGIPQHREPLYSPRPDLVAKYPAQADKMAFWRLPTQFMSLQKKNIADGVADEVPAGADERPPGRVRGRRRGDAVESVACRAAAGELRRDQSQGRQRPRLIKDGEYVWVKSPTGAQIKVKAMVTERVGAGTTFIPFHFSGWWQGKDMLEFYPEGAHPIVRAEAVNTATTYGYDAVTMMQETKTTLCQVAKITA